MEKLINIGFKKAGEWALNDDTSIVFNLDDSSLSTNILYAFVCDKKILYVGKSKRTIKERMANYKNADASQSTNVKVKQKIVELLQNNSTVEIYMFTDSGLLQYGPFAINLSAGLEDSIVEDIKPEWNTLV